MAVEFHINDDETGVRKLAMAEESCGMDALIQVGGEGDTFPRGSEFASLDESECRALADALVSMANRIRDRKAEDRRIYGDDATSDQPPQDHHTQSNPNA